MPRPIKIPTEPSQLRAILELRRAGWHPGDIMSAFGISRATFDRRLAEIRRIKATAEASR